MLEILKKWPEKPTSLFDHIKVGETFMIADDTKVFMKLDMKNAAVSLQSGEIYPFMPENTVIVVDTFLEVKQVDILHMDRFTYDKRFR